MVIDGVFQIIPRDLEFLGLLRIIAPGGVDRSVTKLSKPSLVEVLDMIKLSKPSLAESKDLFMSVQRQMWS